MTAGSIRAFAARPAVRYDERQSHCLAAMGLVAWVPVASRNGPAPLPRSPAGATDLMPLGARTGRADEVPAEVPPLATVKVPPGVPVRVGSCPLVARSVLPFEWRGSRVHETGNARARLLVVIERERDQAADQPPLVGEPASLFQLMLRSIGLERDDVSLCVAAAESAATDPCPDAVPVLTVGELLDRAGGARRRLVQLVQDWTEDAATQDLAADSGSFKLPHPALLLVRPMLKREAWSVLKAVRRELAGPDGIHLPDR